MSVTLGVAESKAQIDSGTISGVTSFGTASGSSVGFYGTTPITQRSGGAQATSAVGTASSADVTTAVKAALIEVMNTLQALGLWAGS